MNEAAALPITGGSVVRPAQSVLRPPPTPTRHHAPFPGSPVIGRVAPTTRSAASPGRGGPPQFPPPPSKRTTPHTPGGSSELHIQALHPFHGLRRVARGSAPPLPPEGGQITTWQASLNAADRLVAPPKGLSTLGFDPTRFQTEPPACYPASRQLPGRDSHPLATTSLCQITIYMSTSNSGRTAEIQLIRCGVRARVPRLAGSAPTGGGEAAPQRESRAGNGAAASFSLGNAQRSAPRPL